MFILCLGCLLAGVLMTSRMQAQARNEHLNERKELQEKLRNCEDLFKKIESGEYVAVKSEGILIAISKNRVIEELTLQSLAGEITSEELTQMSRLLGIWTKEKLTSLKSIMAEIKLKIELNELDLSYDTAHFANKNWVGTWVSGDFTLIISANGDVISASFQYKSPPHSTGKGQWTGCSLEGNTAVCDWSENYEDEDKSVVRGGKLVVTRDGDSITGTSTEENEPLFTWKQGVSPYPSSIRKNARWPINLTRKK